jgi:hypothetical protein
MQHLNPSSLEHSGKNAGAANRNDCHRHGFFDNDIDDFFEYLISSPTPTTIFTAKGA